MNLPTSRNTTYGANTPIKSADLNAIQDLLIELFTRTKKANATAALLAGGAALGGSPGIVQLTGGGQAMEFSVPVEDGLTLTSVSVIVKPQTSGSVEALLYEIDPAVGATQIGSTVTSSGTGLQTLTCPCTIPIAPGDVKTYVLEVLRAAGAANLVYGFIYTTIPT